MTYFAFFMLFMMLIVGGISVDLMQNEMERTRLQATLDRAILAAADLDQTLDPQSVVSDYFDKAGLDGYQPTVTVDQGLNFRTVMASASGRSQTRFMKFLGVDDLPVPAVGTAQERQGKVEISMVLDISGSMGRNNKMANLQVAAKTFVDTVLTPENEDLISISLVPYTAQVNAGETIFDTLNTTHVHDWSYCLDFIPSDFEDAGLLYQSRVYEQMQHFEYSSNFYGYAQSGQSDLIANPGCPNESFEEILPFTQNATQLNQRIDLLRARANTAIHLGMKWGTAMLDPSFRPITNELTINNEMDATFAGRPVAYSDTDTLKTVILMTDGENVPTYRIEDRWYDRQSRRAFWSNYPVGWQANRTGTSWGYWTDLEYSKAQADGFLDSICDAAKTSGIVVWSIGFEVNDTSADIMRDCASSPSHFFRVEGIEIQEAFEAIAKQINQLGLIQ